MEEKELCTRTFNYGGKKKLLLALGIISIILGLTAVVVNIVIRIKSAKRYGPIAFKLYQGPYWIGWGVLALFIGLAILFLYLYFKRRAQLIITLTNKRIRTAYITDKHHSEESIMLNKIVSFEQIKNTKTHAMTIMFATPRKNHVFYNLDQEFYDLFINAL